MPKDGIYSYIHLDDPKKVLYMEQWKQEPLPFDDIETHNLVEATSALFPKLFLDDEDEEDGTLTIHPAAVGNKIYKSRTMREKVWSDLSVSEKFLDETSELNKIRDETLVPSLGFETEHDLSLADFLSNGYNNIPPEEHLDSMMSPDGIPHPQFFQQRMPPHRHRDISLNSTTSDLSVPNNTFQNIRSTSTSTAIQTTPRPGRVRQVSTSDKNFQTPISRIMR
ncbi:hypothetical protein JA1_003506 [Spathaspora sp. JA1]|nr:hypothetical protein JA1_003506 [Spathaspora sp. JA1]